ncbi:MAG: ABC transporter substrate-binding protein [Sporichthyaceae bacterium]
MARALPAARVFAVAAAAGLVLAACGSKDDTAAPPVNEPAKTQVGNGVLKIGTLLPQTGSLQILGPPQEAGVQLALKDINAAGGVLGKPVELTESDSGDTKNDIANPAVDRMLSENADAIVGAAASSVTKLVIDKITGSGVVMISGSATSTDFSTWNDKGLFFRTAPSDVFQGRIVGETAAEDGAQSLSILARQDSYGTSLATQAEKAFTEGGGELKEKIIYNESATDFSADVAKIKAADPDAIAVIAFDETSKIVEEMIKQGLLPMKTSGKKLYFVDGNMSNSLSVAPASLEGIKGTIPGAAATTAFQARLKEFDANLTDYSYAGEAYDATVLLALATEAAKSDLGKDIAAKMIEVSTGGTKCTEVAKCLELVRAGTDVDYDGISGPIEFDTTGEPSFAAMGVYQFGADNKFKLLKTESGSVSGAPSTFSPAPASTSSPSPSTSASPTTSSPSAGATSSATSTATTSPSPSSTSTP